MDRSLLIASCGAAVAKIAVQAICSLGLVRSRLLRDFALGDKLREAEDALSVLGAFSALVSAPLLWIVVVLVAADRTCHAGANPVPLACLVLALLCVTAGLAKCVDGRHLKSPFTRVVSLIILCLADLLFALAAKWAEPTLCAARF